MDAGQAVLVMLAILGAIAGLAAWIWSRQLIMAFLGAAVAVGLFFMLPTRPGALTTIAILMAIAGLLRHFGRYGRFASWIVVGLAIIAPMTEAIYIRRAFANLC